MSLKSKIWLSVLAIVLTLSAVTAVARWTRLPPPPVIDGTLMPDARSLTEFSLLDHQNRPFTGEDLKGRWHIVSYGYTFCPDVCPTTLTTLARVKKMIEQDGQFTDVRFLFYTVDPERDTTDRLAEYVPWFDPDFVGLTITEPGEEADRGFERSLGMQAILTPLEEKEGLEGFEGYQVSHGVVIYLLNPEGSLQAVFKPKTDPGGLQYFTVDQIYRDYRAIRRYVG